MYMNERIKFAMHEKWGWGFYFGPIYIMILASIGGILIPLWSHMGL